MVTAPRILKSRVAELVHVTPTSIPPTSILLQPLPLFSLLELHMDMTDEIMPEPHSPSPDSEYDTFVQDDLEFRTITTILSALECHDKITLRNFEVVPKLKPYLKILSALSSLLVRDHETIAILPKHSQRGITLLIGSDASLFDNEESSVSTPTSPSGRLSRDVNQDPRKGNRFGGDRNYPTIRRDCWIECAEFHHGKLVCPIT